MKHFDVIKFVNLAGAVICFAMGVFLAMAFAFNMSLVDKIQEATNFDNWNIFIILAAIVAFMACVIFAIGSWKEFRMSMISSNSVVAETIYILGLGMELERTNPLGSDPPSEASVDISRSSSMVSIFGFEQEDDSKLTSAERKPLTREVPEEAEAKDGIEDVTGNKG